MPGDRVGQRPLGSRRPLVGAPSLRVGPNSVGVGLLRGRASGALRRPRRGERLDDIRLDGDRRGQRHRAHGAGIARAEPAGELGDRVRVTVLLEVPDRLVQGGAAAGSRGPRRLGRGPRGSDELRARASSAARRSASASACRSSC